jgi:hypothetical protein
MTAAFYVPEGDARFRPTDLTRGPWDHAAQHAGPPTALLGRALEAAAGDGDGHLARVTFEILRPVPVDAVLETTAEVARPGRLVRLLTGTLAADGQPLIRASAWWMRTTDVGVESGLQPPPPVAPESGRDLQFFPGAADVGYHTAMEAHFVEGGFTQIGPAKVWMRMRQPLVAGEEPSPLTRVLAAADSGNGVSAAIPFTRYLFVNTDLTVALHRLPAGEWIHMDARTTVQPHGIGLAETVLADEQGVIGRGLQTLLVAAR